jgi:hypothetical protein
MHIYISRNKYTFYMKLSNFLVIFISSSSTCSQFTYILLFQKKIVKLSEIMSFLTQRDQERKESCVLFLQKNSRDEKCGPGTERLSYAGTITRSPWGRTGNSYLKCWNGYSNSVSSMWISITVRAKETM